MSQNIFPVNTGNIKIQFLSWSLALCEGYSPNKQKHYRTVLRKNQVISIDFFHFFQENFGILVVEKRHAINEHYFPGRNGQSGAQSENG